MVQSKATIENSIAAAAAAADDDDDDGDAQDKCIHYANTNVLQLEMQIWLRQRLSVISGFLSKRAMLGKKEKARRANGNRLRKRESFASLLTSHIFSMSESIVIVAA